MGSGKTGIRKYGRDELRPRVTTGLRECIFTKNFFLEEEKERNCALAKYASICYIQHNVDEKMGKKEGIVLNIINKRVNKN